MMSSNADVSSKSTPGNTPPLPDAKIFNSRLGFFLRGFAKESRSAFAMISVNVVSASSAAFFACKIKSSGRLMVVLICLSIYSLHPYVNSTISARVNSTAKRRV